MRAGGRTKIEDKNFEVTLESGFDTIKIKSKKHGGVIFITQNQAGVSVTAQEGVLQVKETLFLVSNRKKKS